MVSLTHNESTKATLIQKATLTLMAHLIALDYQVLVIQKAKKMAHMTPRAKMILMAHLKDWDFQSGYTTARKTQRYSVILNVTLVATVTLMAQLNAL
jgi:hypothetical protein